MRASSVTTLGWMTTTMFSRKVNGGTVPREVGRVVEHVCHGLAALHGLQPPVLHNRLHPGNILACPANHYKVTEFGLAAPATAEPTLAMDSVRYASPELLNKEFGRVGPAADLYALGHVAYEMALGGKLHRQQLKGNYRLIRDNKEWIHD